MASYELEKSPNGNYYVAGLKYPGNMAGLLNVRYEGGDFDMVTDNDQKMHEALYDLYQCNDNLKDGDTFTLDEVVVYRCEGVHVVKVD